MPEIWTAHFRSKPPESGDSVVHWARKGLMTGNAITLCMKRPKWHQTWTVVRAAVTCSACNAEARRQGLLPPNP